MDIFYKLFIALLPVAILMFYIFKRDTEKEPIKEIWIAFGFGVLSVFVSLCFSVPAGNIGLYSDDPATIIGAIWKAFMSAAIPEEIAKFIMLWLFMRRCKEYDQYMDGIVYAVCISLGFAALENILYIVKESEWLSLGIGRALLSVPGHYCNGVLMGYYYSKVRLSHFSTFKDRAMIVVAPIITHGIYDALLFSIGALGNTELDILILPIVALFIYFVYKLHKYCLKRINETVEQDKLDIALRDGGKEE
ncbi:MAG: PrsW family intramembrane metalloprotease [Alistipes sp.]|nr:PrsW family intramembrane metalloprotease [Alistipes sp.]